MRKPIFLFLISILISSCIGPSENPIWSQIQEDGCIFFIQDPSGTRELWFWCEGQQPQPFLEGFSGIHDYIAAGDTKAIYFIWENNEHDMELWISDSQMKIPKRLLKCSSFQCYDLAYSAALKTLAFSDFDDEPRLRLFSLKHGEIKDFLFNATALEFSPDAKYLSFFDRNRDQLVILDLSSGEIIAVDSQEGLIGGWSNDSQHLLYGAMTFNDEIPGVNVFSLNIQNGQSENLSGVMGSSIEFYQPGLLKTSEHFIAAIRNPSSGFNKQLWIFNREGELVTQITSDYSFDHSAYQVNSEQTLILFQRFSPGIPNSQPEVWVSDLDGKNLKLIALNATNPQWVSSN
ncbi:MAG: hypothetical protein FJZ98_05830 [Chloroflexi bacterium]|nr:hypothetical protein [Chloroflexota bacterium]